MPHPDYIQVPSTHAPMMSKTHIPLGEGTYGKVHATRLRGMESLASEEEVVAIKVYNAEDDEDKATSMGQGIPQMQLREIAALCSIPQHPHIVSLRGLILIGAGTSKQASVKAVMPMVRHGDAMRALEKLHPMPWPLLYAWSCHLASAVCHMHANGWLHRDIKLENILVGSNGELIVCDMGLCRPRCERIAESVKATPPSPKRRRIHARGAVAAPSIRGSSSSSSSAPPYACLQYTTEVCTIVTRSPELCILECLGAAVTSEYDAAADMWSLGACLLAMALGCYAFRPAHRLRNEDAVQSIFRVLGRPSSIEWPLLKRAAEAGIALGGGATPSQCAAEQLRRLLGKARDDIPQAWWDTVASLLQIIPGRRLQAPAALRALRGCGTQSLEADGLSYATATLALFPMKDRPEYHNTQEQWEALGPGARVFLPRHCKQLTESTCAKELATLMRRRLHACTAIWACCRCAKVPPLVAVASILCARRIFEHHEVPERNLAAIVCACVSLVAKQLMHCAPTVATLSRCMPGHMRTTHTAAERAEWWVLHVTCAVLVNSDYFAILREWPQSHQLYAEGLRICTVAALLACQESTSVEDAFTLSKKIMAGELAQSSSCAIGRLRDAMKLGTVQPFFRAWTDLWPDCTHILDVWAQR
jgi:serine/threonine protein kinase